MIDFYVFIQDILVHSLDLALTRYCSICVSLSVPWWSGLLPHGDLTDNSPILASGPSISTWAFAKVGLGSDWKAGFNSILQRIDTPVLSIAYCTDFNPISS